LANIDVAQLPEANAIDGDDMGGTALLEKMAHELSNIGVKH
jgi:hypothetical protein